MLRLPLEVGDLLKNLPIPLQHLINDAHRGQGSALVAVASRACEYESSQPSKCQKELAEAADLLELLAAIAADHGATLDTIVGVARRKRVERGGFDMRQWLDRIDPPETRP